MKLIIRSVSLSLCCALAAAAAAHRALRHGDGGGDAQQKRDWPLGWKDEGHYGCDWYAENPGEHCLHYGNVPGTDGYNANNACVVCGGGVSNGGGGDNNGGGGGSHGGNTGTVTIGARPTSSSDGGPRNDWPQGWRDGDGNGCRWYAENPGEHCRSHGTLPGTDGYTAYQACVACGGGRNEGESGGTGTGSGGHGGAGGGSNPHGGSNGKKHDSPQNWRDVDDYGCDWYAEKINHCMYYGTIPGTYGITANQACVACGGGRDDK